MHGLRSCLLAAAAVLVATAGLTVPAGPAAAGGPTFVISGGGFGHGVGMSQWGAKGQADQGRTAAQILSHYYTGTAVGTLPQPNPTVLLATSVFSRIFPAAGGSGPLRLVHQDGTVMLTANPGDTVILELTEDRQWFRASVNGVLVPLKPAQGSFVFVELNLNPTLFDASGHRYRYGRVVAATAGDMIEWIAQDMTMEQYLYGLGEVPSSWPAEALKAQAIAARTYAKNRTETRRASPSWTRRFDLFGSTSDQVFVGYDKEAGPSGVNWVAAVDTTAGRVSTSGGLTIEAYYSSSSGGHTENSGYAFATQLPYLVGVPDPADQTSGNNLFRWTRTFDGDQLAAGLGGGIGTATSISVAGPIGVSGRIDKATVTVQGTLGTMTLTGAQLRSRLGLPSTLIFGFTGQSQLPFGNYESATPVGTAAVVQGWAIDPDENRAIEVHVYVNGTFGGFGYAASNRPDVGAAFPAFGPNHGFEIGVAIPAGTSSLCVYAIDTTNSDLNRPLGCRNVTRASGPPFGNVDAGTRVPGGVAIEGWAIDPDTAGPIEIDVYRDGTFAGFGDASLARGDIGAAFPAYGPNHGFVVGAASPAGSHSFCAFAINVGPGANRLLGCRTLAVSNAPFGSIDAASRAADTVTVSGWAIDPDVAAPLEIHVYVDGAFAGYGYASSSRPDVAAVFPAYGPAHGFSLGVAVGAGAHQVCAFAINAGAGAGNPSLGCRTL